jgi:hypothetical protein
VNGITFSYSIPSGDYNDNEFSVALGFYDPATGDQIEPSTLFSCIGPTFSLFFPLAAGEYAGGTTDAPGQQPTEFPFDLVVGAPGSLPAPQTTCIPPPPTDNGDLSAPFVGIASLPSGQGYWLADAQGGVSAHGNAVNYGSMAGVALNAPIAHIVATPDGKGYWLVASDGGIFTFGDAGFYGSMGGQHLNGRIVDIAPTRDGKGYWLVASDGGIFSFGDAQL